MCFPRLKRRGPIEARKMVTLLFRRMGFYDHATEATGDDGVDVFARKDHEINVVQCKR